MREWSRDALPSLELYRTSLIIVHMLPLCTAVRLNTRASGDGVSCEGGVKLISLPAKLRQACFVGGAIGLEGLAWKASETLHDGVEAVQGCRHELHERAASAMLCAFLRMNLSLRWCLKRYVR